MSSFKISAPGKIILFGEHAVVYGKKAIAAGLNRHTTLEFIQLSFEEKWIYLEMRKLKISKMVLLSQVQEFLLGGDFPNLLDDGHNKFYQGIKEFVNSIGFENQSQKNSLECFFYALVQIVQKEGLKLKAFKVEINSELPIGAGLGSSASFSVCLNASFFFWSQIQKNPNIVYKFCCTDLLQISNYAFNCEKIMHGSPSGIDNYISTYGSVVEFQNGTESNFIPLDLRDWRLLLVDTKIARSTKLLVNKLAALTDKYPEIFHKTFEAIDEISIRAAVIIKQIQQLRADENDQFLEAYKELSLLVNINQGLLSACQVSHSSLDLICMVANKYEFPAKLTGAGGGGFAYIIIPPNASDIKVKDLNSELIKNGFSVIETILGGSGVDVYPIRIQ